MVLVQLEDEAISSYAYENQLAQFKGLSQQFLVTNV
jgi:hypothetical protein